MSITRIYFIYKHNNNKCLLIIIIIFNFHIYTKNKREKSHIMLNELSTTVKGEFLIFYFLYVRRVINYCQGVTQIYSVE